MTGSNKLYTYHSAKIEEMPMELYMYLLKNLTNFLLFRKSTFAALICNTFNGKQFLHAANRNKTEHE